MQHEKKEYQIGLLITQRRVILAQKSKAATRRSLNRRVTYRIGVHTLPDRPGSFLCLHEKLSSIV